MKDSHGAIHKLVWAIKALKQADELSTCSGCTDNIRHARQLVWDVGEELGVDIAGQLQETESTN